MEDRHLEYDEYDIDEDDEDYEYEDYDQDDEYYNREYPDLIVDNIPEEELTEEQIRNAYLKAFEKIGRPLHIAEEEEPQFEALKEMFGIKKIREFSVYIKYRNSIGEIFEENGTLSRIVNGYKPRPSQITAAKIMFRAFMLGEHSIIEGPTGFGKSLAYLIPAAVASMAYQEVELHERFIVATSGISLQDQLIDKDFKLVKRVMKETFDYDVKFGYIRGRSNYICRKKLERINALDNLKTPLKVRNVAKMFRDNLDKIYVDELGYMDYEHKEYFVCKDSSECSGKSCPHNSVCSYMKHRYTVKYADISVVNYHMLFSDYVAGNSILGKYDTLICDESHELSDIFIDFMSKSQSQHTVNHVLNILTNVSVVDPFLYTDNVPDKVDKERTDILIRAQQFYQSVAKTNFPTEKNSHAVKVIDSRGILTTDTKLERLHIKDLYTLLEIFNSMNSQLEDMAPDMDITIAIEFESNGELSPETSEQVDTFYKLCRSVSEAKETTERMLNMIQNYASYAGDPDHYYAINYEDGNSSISYGPIHVRDIFSRDFLKVYNVVLTSATLSVNKNFSYIKEKLGFDLMDKKTLEYIGKTPFDLKKQEKWYIPDNATSAVSSNSKSFTQYASSAILELILETDGGTLVLCTSNYMLNSIVSNIEFSIPGYIRVLKQGTKSRADLLEEFTSDVNSVLFATRSFFTGVDIPGESLRSVIVDKIPFPSPTDPILQKKEQNVKEFGGPSVFATEYLPSATIVLKQAFGRGIRSVNDKCVITLLDSRILEKGYGKSILNTFNSPQITRSLDEVSKFIK